MRREAAVDALQAHLKQRHDPFTADRREGKTAVDLLDALPCKYTNTPTE